MLFACFDVFDYSARAVLPAVLDKLKDDPGVSHEAFKVCDFNPFCTFYSGSRHCCFWIGGQLWKGGPLFCY